MSLLNMRQELLGIPGTNFGLVTTKINEALVDIQNEQVWSFQLQTSGWLTPGLLGGISTSFLSPGTITVTPFSTTVTGDVTATAAWLAANVSPPLLTQQQLRVPYYSLYNIIALGGNGSIAYVNISTAGVGQTPGTYVTPVVDLAGPGTGGSVSITVAANGTVTAAPIVLAAGGGYRQPAINFSQGGTPATFIPVQFATLTLDRPWMEPPQTNGTYMIYQAYFPTPPGFKRFYVIRDTTNNNALDFWTYNQIDLGVKDAQRINFNLPLYVAAYGMDTRTGSATYGQMLYELWPHPLSQLPYTFMCQCNWPALTKPTDIVPYPLTEEIVKHRASELLYMWKESQRGDDMERGSGANWPLLMQAASAEYDKQIKSIRVMDRNLVDLYFTRMQRYPAFAGEPFATVNGQLNVGSF